MALLVVDQHVHFDSRCVVRTKSCLSSPMMIVMMRSGESGLVGYAGRSTANAFEAKIDNRIAAIARELFVFMRKNLRARSIGCYDASGGFSDATEGRIATPS